MKGFRTIEKRKVEDIASYVDDWMKKYPGTKIACGVDSQRVKKSIKTKYAIAIALFYPHVGEQGKGAHIIYRPVMFHEKMDRFTRLWKEIEYTSELANYLVENSRLTRETLECHIDINPNAGEGSHMVFNSAVGWLKGEGFIVKWKPDSFVASSLADSLVR